MASNPCACGEGFLFACIVSLTFEEDGAASLVLMQQGAVLEVSDQLILALHTGNAGQ